MDIYLQGPGTSEINLTSLTSGTRRLIDGVPRGLFDSRPIEQTVRVDVDGNPYLYKVHYRPRVIDIRLIVTGSTAGNLLTAIKTILERAVMGMTPCRLRVVEGSKEAYLDIHPEFTSVIPTTTTSEIILRCVSYGNWYTPSQNMALSYRVSGNVARIVRRSVGWDSLGGGTNSSILALAVAPDGTLYAGGAFTTAGGVSANRIARWNGSTWSPLGSGMDADVTALAVAPSGTLYAGGRFLFAGGVSANRIAQWDGSAWSPLGSGASDWVNALAIAPDGTLYAGGTFTTAGGVTANRIARWNGSTWSPLGSGMNNTVYALAIAPDGTLYAGGAFTTAGGVTANRIARWDGSTWSPLGSGMNNTVYALAIAPDGTLYAGGTFTTAGGVTAPLIAQWDGSAWSPLGSGMNAQVSTLAVAPDGTLYAGGDFTTAGGLPTANRVAMWNGYRWLHVDINLPSASSVRAILGDPLILAGEFAGTASYAAVNTLTVNEVVYPRLVISAQTNARVQSVENMTTGQRVWLHNMELLPGEILIIDFHDATATSTFRGNVLRAIVPGSDMRLKLVRGSNSIRLFIPSGTVHARLWWTPQYGSLAEALA